MRTLRAWRRILTLWLACQLLAGSLVSLANAQPLWDSFLSVLAGPVCLDPGSDDGEAPTPRHTPFCILCAALGGPALAEPPAAPVLPLPSLRAERETLPAAVAASASQRLAAQGCRGPPPAA